MHHCRSQTSQYFYLVLLSDGLELVVAHEQSIARSGFDARRLASGCSRPKLIERIGTLGTHHSGPIRSIKSRFGVLFLFLSFLTPPPTFAGFAFPLVFFLLLLAPPFPAFLFPCQGATLP